MANILTTQEAANCLRCDVTDPNMLDLMPQVDAYIKNATGYDWTLDTPINPVAKSAARILIAMWHANPGMLAYGESPLIFGLSSALIQLEAIYQATQTTDDTP